MTAVVARFRHRPQIPSLWLFDSSDGHWFRGAPPFPPPTHTFTDFECYQHVLADSGGPLGGGSLPIQ